MVEGGEYMGPDSGPGSKSASSFESAGGRLRFTVELRPRETTIVSWKKLLRQANSSKANRPGPSEEAKNEPVSQPASSHPPEAPSSSKQPTENEPKDSQGQSGTNRLSTVIERIERMYAGNGSGDEEDVVLDNVPDDDEYDTEDSFIDDAELDDYFQVDNSSIKHDGFFVNRGKLERIEPTISTNQQPKKRRRKDLTKGHGESDDGHNPNKIVKIGNKGRKASLLIQRNSTSQSEKVTMANIHGEDMQFQASPANAAKSSSKKTADAQYTVNPSGPLNGGATRQDTDNDQRRPGVVSAKNHASKRKESAHRDTLTQRSNNKSSHVSKSQSGKQINDVDGLDRSIQQKGKGGLERFDLNVPASRDSLSSMKAALMQRKEGSSVRSKSTMLEKAIRELEKIVAESRPPSTEVQDPDSSSQSVKRRLPPEIKQKLGKVARLSQVSYGKIPKDVINRLMSIVGHLMQVRTLKRNLKVMANMGLSAKQEKDDRIQKIKQELADMVNLRIPYMKSNVEKQAANSGDFQEADPEEKEALKRKYSMDDVLENKVCDLYDLYAERQDEDSGPPVRRLYEELVGLWPSGFMDTDRIKRAIYRAKDRRGSLRKDREKIKKKTVLALKAEDAVNVTQALHIHEKEKIKKKTVLALKAEDPINVTQALHIHEKSLPDSRHQGSTLTSKTVPSASRLPVAFAYDSNVEKLKKEKMKGSSSSNPVNVMPSNVLPKKKVKRKPNAEVLEARLSIEKLTVSKVEERHKHHKHVTVPVSKSNLQPAVPSGS